MLKAIQLRPFPHAQGDTTIRRSLPQEKPAVTPDSDVVQRSFGYLKAPRKLVLELLEQEPDWLEA